MLSITISNKYDFTGKDYSTIQPRTSIEGTFGKDSSTTYQLTYLQFYIDKFGIQRQIGGSNIISDVDIAAGTWSIATLDLVEGANIIQVKVRGIQTTDEATASVTVTYVPQSRLGIRIDPPTGISAEQFTDKVVLTWLGNSNEVYTEKELTFSGNNEIELVPDGAVDLDTLLLTTAEENLLNRLTFTIDLDYTVVNSEDINLPTKIFRTADSRIPENETILATFNVSQAVDQVRGYNIYAATEAAGGTTGYTKLNSRLITTPDKQREVVTSSTTSQTLVHGVRTTTTSERILSLNEYSYDVAKVTLADFGDRPTTDLTTYFVLTAVAADTTSRSELESVYSIELVAKPFEITNQVQEFTPRTFDEVVSDYISSALVSQPLLDVKPTSVTRDIHIDPVANEFEKAYFMLDFVNKSQSFLTLLAIDDPEDTGSSATDTEYKTSLQLVFNLANQTEVQALIDSQFDKLAANVNVSRKGAEYARGMVTLFSQDAPASALIVSPTVTFIAPLDTGSLKFRSLVSLIIQPEDFFAYYNQATRRFEIDIPVIAEVAGSAGNIDAGAITQTSLTNFFAANQAPFLYGSDEESNRSLAERALVALMGVDFGTVGGYVKEVTSHPGVLKVASQSAGSPFMFRDFDVWRRRHVGGKVDLYVQGSRPLVYQEEFGIEFLRAEDETVRVDSTNQFVIFSNNIIENLISVKRRESDGQIRYYDIEGATVAGRIISLNPNSQRNTILGMAPTDTILVSYYHAGNFSHRLQHQPVKRIVSLVGSTIGTINSGGYIFDNTDDIFQLGNSAQANGTLTLVQTGVDFGIEANTETLTFEGTVPVTLNRYSVDLNSLVLSSGSSTFVLGTDYEIIVSGNAVTKPQIARIASGDIVDGAEVTVQYNASETFAVQYQVESLIESIQTSLEKKEYATADVLVKQANEVPLDISADILLQKGVSQSEVDLRIRTALGRYFGNLRLGDDVYQSDIIRLIDEVSGVYAVELPLIKLSRASDSYVLGEHITVSSVQRINQETQVKINTVFSFPTVDGGGIVSSNNTKRPVGVYVGARYFKGVESLDDVLRTPDSCFIQTNAIHVSPISDEEIASILSGDLPVTANYYTFGSQGSDDIRINVFEHAALADCLFSYRVRS